MQIKKIKSKQFSLILIVIAIGILLAVFILNTDKPNSSEEGHEHDESRLESVDKGTSTPIVDNHEHMPQAQEIARGPHGGKLFTQADYSVEVTIFEQNMPPEFRIYTYQNGKPLAPAVSNIDIQIMRLGSNPENFSFTPESDYLKGNAEVKEPHSFKVNINAVYEKVRYQFAYEQVEARVKITDQQLTLNSIEVLTAGPANIKSLLQLQGEVKLNGDKTVHIVPRLGGIVDAVKVSAGDKIRKGQILATVSSQSIADMRSDLLAAQKKLGLARATFNREKQLWEDKISAQQDYLQAQQELQAAEIDTQRIRQKLGSLDAGSENKNLARYDIKSPIDGVVTHKQLSIGQVVNEADDIFEVADLSTVWVEMIIYAKDINTVKVGQSVTIKSSAFDAEAIGKIAYVSALVGEQTRTAMARVVLNNEHQTWLPGLPVNVALTSEEVSVPLAVSVEGLQTLKDWNVVFGRYGEYFEARPLELGRRDEQYVEVLQGLHAGEKYAAGNSFLIKADIGKAGASHDH